MSNDLTCNETLSVDETERIINQEVQRRIQASQLPTGYRITGLPQASPQKINVAKPSPLAAVPHPQPSTSVLPPQQHPSPISSFLATHTIRPMSTGSAAAGTSKIVHPQQYSKYTDAEIQQLQQLQAAGLLSVPNLYPQYNQASLNMNLLQGLSNQHANLIDRNKPESNRLQLPTVSVPRAQTPQMQRPQIKTIPNLMTSGLTGTPRSSAAIAPSSVHMAIQSSASSKLPTVANHNEMYGHHHPADRTHMQQQHTPPQRPHYSMNYNTPTTHSSIPTIMRNGTGLRSTTTPRPTPQLNIPQQPSALQQQQTYNLLQQEFMRQQEAQQAAQQAAVQQQRHQLQQQQQQQLLQQQQQREQQQREQQQREQQQREQQQREQQHHLQQQQTLQHLQSVLQQHQQQHQQQQQQHQQQQQQQQQNQLGTAFAQYIQGMSPADLAITAAKLIASQQQQQQSALPQHHQPQQAQTQSTLPQQFQIPHQTQAPGGMNTIIPARHPTPHLTPTNNIQFATTSSPRVTPSILRRRADLAGASPSLKRRIDEISRPASGNGRNGTPPVEGVSRAIRTLPFITAVSSGDDTNDAPHMEENGINESPRKRVRKQTFEENEPAADKIKLLQLNMPPTPPVVPPPKRRGRPPLSESRPATVSLEQQRLSGVYVDVEKPETKKRGRKKKDMSLLQSIQMRKGASSVPPVLSPEFVLRVVPPAQPLVTVPSLSQQIATTSYAPVITTTPSVITTTAPTTTTDNIPENEVEPKEDDEEEKPEEKEKSPDVEIIEEETAYEKEVAALGPDGAVIKFLSEYRQIKAIRLLKQSASLKSTSMLLDPNFKRPETPEQDAAISSTDVSPLKKDGLFEDAWDPINFKAFNPRQIHYLEEALERLIIVKNYDLWDSEALPTDNDDGLTMMNALKLMKIQLIREQEDGPIVSKSKIDPILRQFEDKEMENAAKESRLAGKRGIVTYDQLFNAEDDQKRDDALYKKGFHHRIPLIPQEIKEAEDPFNSLFMDVLHSQQVFMETYAESICSNDEEEEQNKDEKPLIMTCAKQGSKVCRSTKEDEAVTTVVQSLVSTVCDWQEREEAAQVIVGLHKHTSREEKLRRNRFRLFAEFARLLPKPSVARDASQNDEKDSCTCPDNDADVNLLTMQKCPECRDLVKFPTQTTEDLFECDRKLVRAFATSKEASMVESAHLLRTMIWEFEKMMFYTKHDGLDELNKIYEMDIEPNDDTDTALWKRQRRLQTFLNELPGPRIRINPELNDHVITHPTPLLVNHCLKTRSPFWVGPRSPLNTVGQYKNAYGLIARQKDELYKPMRPVAIAEYGKFDPPTEEEKARSENARLCLVERGKFIDSLLAECNEKEYNQNTEENMDEFRKEELSVAARRFDSKFGPPSKRLCTDGDFVRDTESMSIDDQSSICGARDLDSTMGTEKLRELGTPMTPIADEKASTECELPISENALKLRAKIKAHVASIKDNLAGYVTYMEPAVDLLTQQAYVSHEEYFGDDEDEDDEDEEEEEDEEDEEVEEEEEEEEDE